MIVGVTALVLWFGGVFSMLIGVVFGFVSFGLVFAGMMCVLPGVVSHHPTKAVKTAPTPKTTRAPDKTFELHGGFSTYRSI